MHAQSVLEDLDQLAAQPGNHRRRGARRRKYSLPAQVIKPGYASLADGWYIRCNLQAGWAGRGNRAKLARTHLRIRDGQGASRTRVT